MASLVLGEALTLGKGATVALKESSIVSKTTTSLTSGLSTAGNLAISVLPSFLKAGMSTTSLFVELGIGGVGLLFLIISKFKS